MKKQISILFLLAAFAVQTTYAGGVKVNSGNLKALSGEKQLLVKYDYTNMKVGKDLTESEMQLDKIPGSQVMGYDFDAGSRIAESYAKAGKMLGKFFSENVK